MTLNKLKGLRAEQGFSQEDMSKLIGISLSSYQRKENGENQFTLREAYKIAQIFRRDLSEIFFIEYHPKWDK